MYDYSSMREDQLYDLCLSSMCQLISVSDAIVRKQTFDKMSAHRFSAIVRELKQLRKVAAREIKTLSTAYRQDINSVSIPEKFSIKQSSQVMLSVDKYNN